MPVIKKKQSLKKILFISMFCLLAFPACDKKQVNQNEKPSGPTVTASQSLGNNNVSLIKEGQQSFLFPMKDGYSYPVLVIAPEFIETLPLKVMVRLFHQQRDGAVPVHMLLPPFPTDNKEIMGEVQINGKWEPLFGLHRYKGQYLGQLQNDPNWQAIADETIRVKSINGEKK